jgi:SAM-dependent methyltransferase
MEEYNKTIKTYRDNFNKYLNKTPQEVSGGFKDWMDTFISYLSKDAKIFELGSATGRDARYFHSLGFEVFCTDVVDEALLDLSKKGFEGIYYDFRDDIKEEWKKSFDGVFANAVLLHVLKKDLGKILLKLRLLLREGGVMAFSLKKGEGEKVSTEKMDSDRFFSFYKEDEIKQILHDLDFEIISFFLVDNKWIQIIVK